MSEKEKKAAKTSESEPKAKKKSGKPNPFVRFFRAIGRFFKDFRGEIKKITWPDRSTVLKSTGIVLVVLVLAGAAIFLVDLGLAKIVDLLGSLAGKTDETTSAAAGIIQSFRI